MRPAATTNADTQKNSPPADPRFTVEPPHIPDHTLLKQIGRGSYGEVWLARNIMGSWRAVKIVYRQRFGSERPYARELAGIRRFEPISRSHEGFIDILHIGQNTEQQYFYYVMELGDDQSGHEEFDPDKYLPRTLTQELSTKGRLTAVETLNVGLSLTKALEHLHNAGLIHRDIKPSNILFVGGIPRLADIGLVADINETQSYVGTEGFIPPEGPGSPQADLYSLGKVLYEICTGRDRNDFPALPAELHTFPDRGLFLELNEVLLRACHQLKDSRYQDAREMHAELALIENGRSVRRLRGLEKAMARVRRIAIISAIILILGGTAYYQWMSIRQRRGEAIQREIAASIQRGSEAFREHRYLAALPYFIRALQLESTPSHVATHRMRVSAALAQSPRLTEFWYAKHPVVMSAISGDGKVLVSGTKGGTILVTRPGTREEPVEIKVSSSALWAVDITADGSRIASSTQNGEVAIYNTSSSQREAFFPHSRAVYGVRFDQAGKKIVTSCADRLIRIFDLQTGQVEKMIEGHTDSVRYAEFSPGGKLLSTGGQDGTARIWDLATGKQIGPSFPHPSWVFSASFSPDEKYLVSASYENRAHVWDIASGKELYVPLMHQGGVTAARFSPDGRFIVTASYDFTARVWDAKSGTLVRPVLQHSGRLIHAHFTPSARQIVTSSFDGTVRIWDWAGVAYPERFLATAVSGDGSHFAQLTDGSVDIRDSQDSRLIQTITPSWPVQEVAFSYSGKSAALLLKGERTSAIQFLHGRTKVGMTELPVHADTVALSRDGAKAAWAAQEKVFLCQTMESTSHSILATGATNQISKLQFSPSGAFLGALSDRELLLWKLPDTKLAARLTLPRSITAVSFSPDEKLVALSISTDDLLSESAFLWRTDTWERRPYQLQHRDGVSDVTFSPKGNLIATSSEDETVVIWNPFTGSPVAPVLPHVGQVNSVQFHSAGDWLTTASLNGLQIWSVSGEPISAPLVPWARTTKAWLSEDRSRLLGLSPSTTPQTIHLWRWTIPTNSIPLPDLVQIAELLSGDQLSAAASSGARDPARLEQIWKTMSVRYPGLFSVSKTEAVAWHKHQVVKAEWPVYLNKTVAEFHLAQAAAISSE
ncbi:MAG: protein kinase [Verrucomicrobiota bacterium]|nr:protein kinase [Verrucomicrobiota bacterium]